jgi:hypothetical protein
MILGLNTVDDERIDDHFLNENNKNILIVQKKMNV